MASGGGEAEIEALRREHAEKVRQIAEKRRQVEDLKRQRSARAEQRGRAQGHGAGDARRGTEAIGPRSVDDLLTEVLQSGGGDATADGAQGVGPLRELALQRGIGSSRAPVELRTEVGVVSESFEPKEAELYTKSVQTDALPEGEGASSPAPTKSGEKPLFGKLAERTAARNRAVRPEEAANSMSMRRTRMSIYDLGETIQREGVAAVEPEPPRPTELSAEERERVMAHPEFHSFFERTTLLVERALGQEQWDIGIDLVGASAGAGGGDGDDAARMKFVDDYIEEKWALGRPVTDVRFSRRREELFLASYGQRKNPSLSDPDGCMLVWNLAMKNRPEMAFSCQSAVLTAQAHRFDPALFFGGTYAGSIVLWDARTKAGPVQRTPLSSKSHWHPVMSMQQVGTQNATNLVTASNDGRLCVWSLAMLVTPQESIDLKNETRSRRDLGVMALSFPENETNVLYVGGEDGSVCQVHIHGSKVGVNESYDGHDGPVTGIDVHPHGDASQYGLEASADLALTSSFDWSVKLWMVKQYQQPVLSLDIFEDYVYDVRWHPSHPAVFSSVDGEGHVDLWNLNRNLEEPVARCTNPNGHRLALNHCHWSLDGKRLAAGDSEGGLSVYAVDRTIAQPRNEDFQQFQDRVRSFQPIQQRRDVGGYGMDGRYGAMPGHRPYSAPFDGRH